MNIKSLLAVAALAVASVFPSFSQGQTVSDKQINLIGRVKDSLLKQDLTDAYVITYDAQGNPADTLLANQGFVIRQGERVPMSLFCLTVGRKDTVLTFDIECPGFQPYTAVYHLNNIGRRENERHIGNFYLERTPRQLGEVTVTASKIKFYNKGDTLVYNADAFQLSEGSMLEALINQMPGVELNSDGQILVNGEYVESLLLNGKEFLDGNNQLMLDNIGAYTVKNVEVYKGNNRRDQWLDDPTLPKELTMNVQLKKEYMMGWIINAQGGYGTEERYMGRLFASWFNPTTNITLLGNINNLNDNRKPGKNDSWTPDMLPDGTKRYKMGAVNYNYERADGEAFMDGSVTVEETRQNSLTTLSRTNFLNGGDTYDNEFDNAFSRNLKISTHHTGARFYDTYQWGGIIDASYTSVDNTSDNVSATFSAEQAGVTLDALESMYSVSSSPLLEAVINRSITRSDSRTRDWEFSCAPDFRFKTGSGDYFFAGGWISYHTTREEIWKDYNINFGADPIPAERRRQYFDNTPNTSFKARAFTEYVMRIGNGRLALNYEYQYTVRKKDSDMYALDRLADMGVFGSLPASYIDTFDPASSYTTRQTEHRHTLTPRYTWTGEFADLSTLTLSIAPKLRIVRRHLDYTREGRDYPVTDNSFLTAVGNFGASVDYRWGCIGEDSKKKYQNKLVAEYRLNPSSPDLFHMVDVEDSTDPMNITVGNPYLRNAYENIEKIEWTYLHPQRPLRNVLSFTATQTVNALVRGYTYDTSTGIRRTKSYNVSGNKTWMGVETFDLQFGRRQQYTLTSTTSGTLTDYADMIGVNMATPSKSTVSSGFLSQKLRLGWQIGRQNIEVKGEAELRHTSSTREDFSPINARHFNYGVIGRFSLPYGLGINTDFTCYTRRGYGSKELDTTDAIFNVGLSYAPRKSRWVFMLDGFDLLHQLSNVHYAVSASGRTVSYTNALPRYVLLTVQYRLNLQPRKK